MRIEVGMPHLRVVLSERNVRALLSKLDMEGSARTIEKDSVYVTIERDAEHYGDRVPGRMHPITERALEEGDHHGN